MKEMKQLLQSIKIRYAMGLEYIRNNPNLSTEDVKAHYDVIKTMYIVRKQLEALCE
jgi:hypothetical protein